MGHSCRTLLRDTLVRHSSGTLLRDTLVLPAPQILRVLKLYYKVASSQLPAPLSAEGCAGTGQIALSLAFRALDAHDLRRGLRGHRTNRTLACISLARHARSPQRVARAPDKSHSRLHFARSTRTVSAEGCAGTGQIALSLAFRALDTHDLRRRLRAHGTNRTLACISRTRHARSPQRVARAWDKSHSRLHFAHSTRTISAEGCASSLQNERFVRDFLKNSHFNVCKRSVSFETSKVKRKHPSEHTHHAALPSSFAIPAPPNNIRSHANPNGTATFTSTTTHNLTIPCACHESFPIHRSNAHKILCLPRNVTSLTPRNLTIPCACHENRTSTLQSPREVLRLPRKVTISSHVSFNKICTTPHVWNDFDPFRAHSHPPKSPFQLRLVTKTELRCHTLKRKSQWHGHIQHPKDTTLQTLIPMELRSNLPISQNAAPVQRNASRFSRDMSCSCKSQWISGAN